MTKAQIRHRKRYDRYRLAGICIGCDERLSEDRRVRAMCLECSRLHSARQRERKGSRTAYICGKCTLEGHNRRTCAA